MDQIQLSDEEINALLERVKGNGLQEGDYEIIKSMADAIIILGQALDNKATFIKRLLAMLFGPKTEKKDEILKDNEPEKGIKSHPNLNLKKRKKGMERYLLPAILELIESSYPMKNLSPRIPVHYVPTERFTQ